MIRQRAAALVAAVVAGLGGLGFAVLSAPAATAATAASSTLSAAATTKCAPSDVVIVSRNADLTTVSVKLAAGSAGVSCDVTLHSYETQGPTWKTSGKQTYLGSATVHLTTTTQTLTVPAPLCFGQDELVIGTTRNDGIDGPLPHYPTGVFPSSTVIAVQHVAKPCGSGSPSPSVSPSVLPTSTETSSVSPSVSPSGSVLPTSTATETVTPLASVTPSPSPSVLGVTFTNPPQQGGPLPFTGAPVGMEVGAGAGLIAAGVLVLVARRRLRGGAR